MIERLGSQASPEQSKPDINSLPLDSPDLHFLFNDPNHTVITNATGQSTLFSAVQEKYGVENVKKSVAMINGKHIVTPDLYGIYVDAKRWAELNSVQATLEHPITDA